MSENVNEENSLVIKTPNNIAKKISRQDELIAFCRLLTTASKSGKPFVYSLELLTKNQYDDKSITMAENIANKLKNGYSIDEAVKSIKDMDPVLARLMPLLGNERLVKVFEIYSNYLVKQETCLKQISNLVWYPLLVMILSFLVIIYLNLFYFPVADSMATFHSFFDSWSLNLLYFMNLSYWPLSLIIPGIIVYLIIDCAIFMISGHFFSSSLWSRLSGIDKTIEMNDKTRLAAFLFLYTEAGYSLSEAIDASLSFFDETTSKELLDFNQAFIQGNKLSEVLYKSNLMSDILKGNETADELVVKFKYAYDAYSYDTITLIKVVSDKLFYLPLIIAGLVVLAVSLGLFGSYGIFMGNII